MGAAGFKLAAANGPTDGVNGTAGFAGEVFELGVVGLGLLLLPELSMEESLELCPFVP